MRSGWKSPWTWLAIVVGWRLLLLLTAQPVPGNDAFLFDGAIVNWLLHGQYFNPSLAECFPISGNQVFAAYPPFYQALLLPWMWAFGTSALSAMWFHFVWFSIAAILLLKILQFAGFVAVNDQDQARTELPGVALLFLCAVTFDDRPEGLAHVFGLLALLLTVRGLTAPFADPKPGKGDGVAQTTGSYRGIGVVLALFCSLYTSLVVGAFYCAITILTRVAAWLFVRRPLPWAITLAILVLFSAVTFIIARLHPLWWQGFLENARQTPVSTTGFRLPQASEIVKIVRNAPVFIVALLFAPWLIKRWSGLLRQKGNSLSNPDCAARWIVDCVLAAVLVAGWILLAGTLTLFTANYVIYAWYTQVLLAAGLIRLALGMHGPKRLLLAGILGCSLLLVSVRVVGLSSWGVLCASDVSYGRAKAIIQQELQPYSESGSRPVISSAFLYQAANEGVRRAIHSDWPYDRRGRGPGSDLALMSRLRPSKLVLTQFDYYRVYAPILDELARHPELCSVKVRNTTRVPAPDSYASLQRVLQHVSWAPVIVDLVWSTDSAALKYQ